MSYTADYTLAAFARALMRVGVSGFVAAHAVAASAREGVLVLSDLAATALEDRVAARGSAAAFTILPTGLIADTLPLFRSALEENNLQFQEGGTIQFEDGSDRDVTYTVLDPSNRVLFFVRPSDEGTVEILFQGAEVPQIAVDVLIATTISLAKETLARQGYAPTREGTDNWAMDRQNEDGTRERVVFNYHHGDLHTEAVTVDRSGHVLDGNACPDLQDFDAHFSNGVVRPLPSGAARRPSANALHIQPADRARRPGQRER